MNEVIKQYLKPGHRNLILIYILYLAGLMAPMLPVIGAAFAYANKEHPNKFLTSHYIFALRSFCIAGIGFIISHVTMIILIYTLVLVWGIVRSVVAVQYLIQQVPHPNPLTFWIK